MRTVTLEPAVLERNGHLLTIMRSHLGADAVLDQRAIDDLGGGPVSNHDALVPAAHVEMLDAMLRSLLQEDFVP